jgi:leucyl aminopeptidase
MPANHLGPEDLATAAQDLANSFTATCEITSGHDLETNFPLIHGVGQASDRKPRLIDLNWTGPNTANNGQLPQICLVGKGVCFDTGGLDLKPASGMLMMKKDMGGSAQVLGLAHMIMATNLPVKLRVLIPAVENSVSGNAIRPMDVLSSHKGLTVEIGNTDAEGRLVLADALAYACEAKPDLILDFATLTGAARVALGPALPALFGNDDSLIEDILDQGQRLHDPLWHMPLFAPYEKMLISKTADLTNAPLSPFAGAITAALFLKAFVDEDCPWVHIDLIAWNIGARPGRPEGGEAQTIRAVFEMLRDRFK